MSYDVWLEVDMGSRKPIQIGDDWNCTSNCSPAWREAGAGRVAGLITHYELRELLWAFKLTKKETT